MPQYINQDGKKYIFTPGKGGSLTDQTPRGQRKEITGNPHVSKVVPCTNCKEPVSSNDSSCSACGAYQAPPVGGSRG